MPTKKKYGHYKIPVIAIKTKNNNFICNNDTECIFNINLHSQATIFYRWIYYYVSKL